MSEHPEFPQERPAVKYIIDQVSRIQNAEACGIGYYKTLGTVLYRLDRADQMLNEFSQDLAAIKRLANSDIMNGNISELKKEISATLEKISESQGKILAEQLKTVTNENLTVTARAREIMKDARATNLEMKNEITRKTIEIDKLISETRARLNPPRWQSYLWWITLLLIGYLIGMRV